MFIIDTNVFVYAANARCGEHATCRGLLKRSHSGLLPGTGRHAEVAAQTLQEVPAMRGNLLHDAHTAILMREHGIRRIYTRDTDFHRFPFLEVVDPLAAMMP